MFTRIYNLCRHELLFFLRRRFSHARSYEESKENLPIVSKPDDTPLDEQNPIVAGNEKLESSLSTSPKPMPGLWITGLAGQYPPYRCNTADFEHYVRKFYDVEKPSMKKLLAINNASKIETRSVIFPLDTRPDLNGMVQPDIHEQDNTFREAAVDLAVQACHKALKEWGGAYGDITHAVGTTCTNTGNPGYDLLVTQQLGLREDLDRLLVHGVGCAGGLAALRTAAQIAMGASARGRPARILVFACELASLGTRSELDFAAQCADGETNIAPALFSDGAAAFVLCNELASEAEERGIFQLIDWAVTCIPNTQQHMSYLIGPNGYRTILTKEIPLLASRAIAPLFSRLLPSFQTAIQRPAVQHPADFDWALHPGGWAILQGTQKQMNLSADQLRASYEIYRTCGNSSSPTVLIVLDRLRAMGHGRENAVAVAFGPGLTVEMAMFKRCRKSPLPSHPSLIH